MLTKDEVLKKLKAGEYVFNYVWWFNMKENGSIHGGCDDPDCCDWDFETFDGMWNEFDSLKWN